VNEREWTHKLTSLAFDLHELANSVTSGTKSIKDVRTSLTNIRESLRVLELHRPRDAFFDTFSEDKEGFIAP
jgi:hypothetical protein